MAPTDTILLQSILDRLENLGAKVDHIAEKQAVIAERVDSHIAQTTPVPESKNGWLTALGVIRSWVLPIILAIFLLGRQSVEHTHQPMKQYPPNAIIGSAADDTFISSNRRFDSLLIKQIMKGVKP